MERKESGDACLCYEVPWHRACEGVVLDYPYLFCGRCRCVAHIDLVAKHITVGAACLCDPMPEVPA